MVVMAIGGPAEDLSRGGIEIEAKEIRGGGGGRGGDGGGGGGGTDRQRIFAIVTVVRARGPPLHSHDGRWRVCRQRPCLSRVMVGGRGVVGVDGWRVRMCTVDGGYGFEGRRCDFQRRRCVQAREKKKHRRDEGR